MTITTKSGIAAQASRNQRTRLVRKAGSRIAWTAAVFCLTHLSTGCWQPPKGGLKSIGKTLAAYDLQTFPIAEDYPEDDAVVVGTSTDVEMWFGKHGAVRLDETRTRLVRIFRNVEEYATTEIVLHPGEKIVDIEARTITPENRPLPLAESDFHVQRGARGGGVFHSDVRIVRFTFPNVEPNCLVEYNYTIRKDIPFLFDRWYVQDKLPIVVNRYSLTVPSWFVDDPRIDFDWRYNAHNCARLAEPTGTRVGDTVVYSWEVHDVEPLAMEPFMPPADQLLSFVQFAPTDFREWNQLSEWYVDRCFEPQVTQAASVPSRVRKLTAGLHSHEEKIDAIRAYVESLRYVAIELGDGGIIPSTPDEVLARGSGDCKDKSTLLVAMLKEAGIEASPALIGVRRASLVEGFPAWSFNHMIVAAGVGEDRIWIDPTSQFLPLGQLPGACQATDALLLNDDGTSTISRTPEERGWASSTHYDLQVFVLGTADAQFELGIQMEGQAAASARRALWGADEKATLEFCRDLLAGEFVDAEQISAKVRNLEEVSEPLEIDLAFVAHGAIRKQGDVYLLDGIPMQVSVDLERLPDRPRIHPLYFEGRTRISRNVQIHLGQSGLEARSVPESVEIGQGTGLAYRSEFQMLGGSELRATQEFRISSRHCPPDAYSALREIAGRVHDRADETIVLQRRAS